MKDPVKRLRKTIAVAVVFLIAYTAVMLYIEQRHNEELIMADSINKTESVRGMIEGYGKTADEIGRRFCEHENARVKLEVIRLLPQVTGGEFRGERFGENGMVVRVHNNEVGLPPQAEGLFPMLTAQTVTGEYQQTRLEMAGASGTENAEEKVVLVTSGRISGEWYYVRWTPASEYDDYIRSRVSMEVLSEAVQSVNDIELLVIPSERSEAEDGETILHKTKGFAKYSTLRELGISAKNLREESFVLHIDGKELVCFPIEIENLGYTALCCNCVENEKMAILGDIIAQVLFAAVLLAGLITWCYSVQWLVRRERLSEKQRQRYSPEVVKRRTTRLTIMATLVVTVFGFTTVMVQYMYHENRIGSNVLDMLKTQISDGGN